MKGEALLFMLFSWMLICSLSVFCFTMLFTHPEVKKKVEREESFYEEREEIT
ncbi:hypothetical protein JCM9492_05560 [Aquifex pyrophilus]